MDEVKRIKIINELNLRIKELGQLLPKDVFDFSNFYFAGGCIYSLYNDKEPKDYDVFCRCKKAAKRLLEYFTENLDKCNFISRNAISVGKFQFIIRYVGKPETEVAKFDFKHNMFFYDGKEIHSLVGWEPLESNRLEFNSNRARDVLNILTRIPKFLERGMEITQSEIYNILEVGTRPTNIFRERASVKKFKKRNGKY